MLWTFLKYFTLGYFVFLTSYIFIINIISLDIGNYYSNTIHNTILTTLRYIQYHLVYNIYKSKDIIVNNRILIDSESSVYNIDGEIFTKNSKYSIILDNFKNILLFAKKYLYLSVEMIRVIAQTLLGFYRYSNLWGFQNE